MRLIRLMVGETLKELPVSSVSELLPALGLPEDGRGIAIAINDTVISRSRWPEHELREGDRVEIVKAVQGG